MITEWFDDAPKEKGYYLFYGWTSEAMFNPRNGYDAEITMVQVKHGANGNPFYVGNGAFLFANEMRGVWKKVEIQSIPLIKRWDYE